MAAFMFLHSGLSKSAWKSMVDETGDPPVIMGELVGLATDLSASFSAAASLVFSLLLAALLLSSFSAFVQLAPEVDSEEDDEEEGALLNSALPSLEAPDIVDFLSLLPRELSFPTAAASLSFSFLYEKGVTKHSKYKWLSAYLLFHVVVSADKLLVRRGDLLRYRGGREVLL